MIKLADGSCRQSDRKPLFADNLRREEHRTAGIAIEEILPARLHSPPKNQCLDPVPNPRRQWLPVAPREQSMHADS